MHKIWKTSFLLLVAAALSFGSAGGCNGNDKSVKDTPDHPKKEHPQGEHPKGEHPNSEHPQH